MRLQFVLDCGTVQYILESDEESSALEGLGPQSGKWSFRVEGEVKINGQPAAVELRRSSGKGAGPARPTTKGGRESLLECAGPLANTRLLQFDTSRLAAPSQSNDEVPELASNGSGLASVLAAYKLSDEERFNAIESALCSVVPVVTRLRVGRRKVSQSVSDAILFDTLSANGLPAHFVSEGTLLVLGLLTVLLGPRRPRLLLLDDFDRALHPLAQKELLAQLRKVLTKWPDLQIVATTHSPLLLDHLMPEEVRITSMNDEGSVVVGRLEDHAKFDRWKDEMRPGEFWSMVGEKWLSQAPSAAVSE